MASGNLVTARPIGVLEGVDYHHTGEVRRVDRKGISRLLDERSIVLLSPLGYSPTGEIFNLACEDVATRAAIELGADKLLLFGAEPGLLDADGKLVRELRPQQVARICSAWAAITRANCWMPRPKPAKAAWRAAISSAMPRTAPC